MIYQKYSNESDLISNESILMLSILDTMSINDKYQNIVLKFNISYRVCNEGEELSIVN